MAKKEPGVAEYLCAYVLVLAGIILTAPCWLPIFLTLVFGIKMAQLMD